MLSKTPKSYVIKTSRIANGRSPFVFAVHFATCVVRVMCMASCSPFPTD